MVAKIALGHTTKCMWIESQEEAKMNTWAIQMTKIDVVIPNDKYNSVNPAWAAYGGDPGGHYESIPAFLPKLVGQSPNL